VPLNLQHRRYLLFQHRQVALHRCPELRCRRHNDYEARTYFRRDEPDVGAG
jgi:hypothetical protein